MSGKMFFVNPYFQIKDIADGQKVDESLLQKFTNGIIQDNIKNYENQ
jgi:hypothetical protein